jgi:hypothetical protein
MDQHKRKRRRIYFLALTGVVTSGLSVIGGTIAVLLAQTSLLYRLASLATGLAIATMVLAAGTLYFHWKEQRGHTLVRQKAAPKGLLIDLLIPPDRADDMLNNLLGAYDRWVEKYGARTARRIFVAQSVLVVLTYWTDWLLRRVKLLKLLRRS